MNIKNIIEQELRKVLKEAEGKVRVGSKNKPLEFSALQNWEKTQLPKLQNATVYHYGVPEKGAKASTDKVYVSQYENGAYKGREELGTRQQVQAALARIKKQQAAKATVPTPAAEEKPSAAAAPTSADSQSSFPVPNADPYQGADEPDLEYQERMKKFEKGGLNAPGMPPEATSDFGERTLGYRLAGLGKEKDAEDAAKKAIPATGSDQPQIPSRQLKAIGPQYVSCRNVAGPIQAAALAKIQAFETEQNVSLGTLKKRLSDKSKLGSTTLSIINIFLGTNYPYDMKGYAAGCRISPQQVAQIVKAINSMTISQSDNLFRNLQGQTVEKRALAESKLIRKMVIQEVYKALVSK